MSLRNSWIIGSLTVLLLAVVTSFSYFAYTNRILPGVEAAGLKLGGTPIEQAEKKLNQRIEDLGKIELSLESKTFSADPKKLVIDWGTSLAVADAYQFGRLSTDRSIELIVKVNEFYLRTLIDQLNPEFIKPVKHPGLTLDGGQVVISTGKPGRTIDVDDLKHQLAQLAANPTNKPIELLANGIPPAPIANADLIKEQATKLVATPIVIIDQNQTFRPDKKTILSWLAIKPEDPNTLWIDDNKLTEYVGKLAKQVNRKAKPKEIDPGGNIVFEGQEGRTLDVTKAAQNIKETLALPGGGTVELTVVTTPAGEKQVPKPFTPGLYSGKYIEINLAKQTLYRFDGEQLVSAHQVSTGKWSTPTPIGEFNINNKIGRAYSRRYNLYMPYWMSFIGGKYGIHELPEFANGRKEGEGHLGTPVSHGCIRLGVEEAQQVYDWVEVGTPVVIRKG